MAKVCFLCGGPLHDGKCTECGLDNTKNDKKYQLNMHNDSGAHFHDGDCEDGLNKERKPQKRRRKKKALEKPETFDYGEMLEQKKQKTRAGSGQRKMSSQKAGRDSGAASATGRPSGKQKKKKRSSVFWIILICLGTLLVEGALEDMDNLMSFVHSLGNYWEDWMDSQGLSFVWEDDDETEMTGEADEYGHIGDEDAAGLPEKIRYDEDSGLYTELLMDFGVYTVGYDIPAGTYQFHIEDAGYCTATVSLCNEEGQGDYLYLYSARAREDYAEYLEADCPYGEYSQELSLEDGDQIFIESSSGTDLYLYGLAEEGSSLRQRVPQSGLEEVLLENEETMTAGVDFEPGVYDLILDDEIAFVYVAFSSETGLFNGDYSWGISLDPERHIYCRLPIEEGTEICLQYAYNDETVRLAPSY